VHVGAGQQIALLFIRLQKNDSFANIVAKRSLLFK